MISRVQRARKELPKRRAAPRWRRLMVELLESRLALSSVAGTVYLDLDGNGTRGSSEPGLDGWVAYADLDSDGTRDSTEPLDTTHEGGQFTIAGLLPGTHRIREELQANWTQTTPATGFHEVDVTSASMISGLEFGNRWPGNVFIVNSTADPGDGVPNAIELTLREAIAAANATANLGGPDLIMFNMPASDLGHIYYHNDGLAGQVSTIQIMATAASNDSLLSNPDPDWPHSWFTIRPGSALPSITGAVVLDGDAQPGASPNTVADGSNAVLRIELDGSGAAFADGLGISAGGSAVRGLVINRFDRNGIVLLTNGGNSITGNRIGTDVSGNLDLGNDRDGIRVDTPGNKIGGTTSGARNVISGNRDGILIFTGAGGNLVQGNYIGTSAAGTADLGNSGEGVHINAASSNIIGGTTAGTGNLISGNNRSGVSIIGTSAHTGNQVLGNRIGTDATGTTALGNSLFGVTLQGVRDTLVGGTAAGAGNTIAHNGLAGVNVSSTSAIRNAILSNSIFSNGGLGIDIQPNGPNFPQDAGDADSGANNQQNFPVLLSALATPTDTIIGGVLESIPNTMFRVELFASAAADPTGFGEGQTYLGAIDVTTDAGGSASFGARFPIVVSAGQFVTATATVLRSGSSGPGFGDTSEFAQSVEVVESGEVRGAVWHDRDTDGSRGTDEPGLAGWTVFLDDDHDGQFDSNERSAATDADGNYAFAGLAPGTYNVAPAVQLDWSQSSPVVVPEWIYVTGNGKVLNVDDGLTLDIGDDWDRDCSIFDESKCIDHQFDPTWPVGHFVAVFDFDLGQQDAWQDAEHLDGWLSDVEIGPGGDVYVAVGSADRRDPNLKEDCGWGEIADEPKIVQYTYDGRFLREIELPADTACTSLQDEFYWYPAGFDVLPDGSLLVAQPNNNRFVQLNPDGSVAHELRTPESSPTDVSVFGDEQFFVWSDGAATDPTRNPLAEFRLNVRPDERFWISRPLFRDELELRDVTGEVFRTLQFDDEYVFNEYHVRVDVVEALETVDGSIFGTGSKFIWKIPSLQEFGRCQVSNARGQCSARTSLGVL